MSETITLSRDIAITVYRVQCADCGQDLNVEALEADHDGDLLLTIEKCEDCTSEAYDRGLKEGREENE